LFFFNKIFLFFRTCKTRRKQLDTSQKNTLDGDLLWRYFDLSFIERNELLSRLGMTTDQVKKNKILVTGHIVAWTKRRRHTYG